MQALYFVTLKEPRETRVIKGSRKLRNLQFTVARPCRFICCLVHPALHDRSVVQKYLTLFFHVQAENHAEEMDRLQKELSGLKVQHSTSLINVEVQLAEAREEVCAISLVDYATVEILSILRMPL